MAVPTEDAGNMSKPLIAGVSAAPAPLKGVASKFVLVSVPTGVNSSTTGALQEKVRDVATCWPFDVPPLLVGTQDTLMVLSEELSKVDAFAEATTKRIAQQYEELEGNSSGLNVRGASADTYLCQFQWEDAKYSPKSPLRETTGRIAQQVQRLDEEIRTKSMAYNNLARDLAAEQRKEGSSLLTKNLSEIVKPEHFVETEYLTTLLVVVPKTQVKEWLNTYEKLTNFVLPRSSSVINEDSEYALYTVILFKRIAEDFKNLAREKKFTVREFGLDQLSDKAKEARKQKLADRDTQRRKLVRWCIANFTEAFFAWVHIKVVRVFVESVLRYGLPANFQTTILRPKKDEKKLLVSLTKVYESLADKKMLAKGKDDDLTDKEEFLPFVYATFDCDFTKQQ